MATGLPVVPLAVTMRDPGAPDGQVAAFLGTVARRGQEDTVSFAEQDMSAPFITRNDAMWAYVEPEMRRRLADMGPGETTSARVGAALVELLASGHCGVEDVAFLLGYAEPNSFHRAFRTWAGTTVGQFRAHGSGDASAAPAGV
ncbi:MAG: helix-turn-helix domain-containing protein [Actinomyces sp.]|uniref:helix-turn-helix domain-containing protein n=1 Tax=Actinomyces sp. TaxID=29317 RepID=UPI0026DC9483|nr:helix-turn-helix domain-containing protein [Actinomyces sp.]MDO4242437.1 helix-turn-helix domain-containing protein [Actinomyces sp.]